MGTDMVYEPYAYDIKWKDGAAGLLFFPNAKNKCSFLAASCEERCYRAVLFPTGIAGYFEKIFYTRTPSKRKEHPAVFKPCAAYAKVKSERCVVPDDIYPSLLGSHKAGMASTTLSLPPTGHAP